MATYFICVQSRLPTGELVSKNAIAYDINMEPENPRFLQMLTEMTTRGSPLIPEQTLITSLSLLKP